MYSVWLRFNGVRAYWRGNHRKITEALNNALRQSKRIGDGWSAGIYDGELNIIEWATDDKGKPYVLQNHEPDNE